MSSCEDSSSEDYSSSDDLDQASRKVDVTKRIDACFPGSQGLQLRDTWSLVLDDGMFQRQAIFGSPDDLWRHLDKIDNSMAKIRRKCKKGTVRLFKQDYSELLQLTSSKEVWETQGSTHGAGKWLFRFSRKFQTDLNDLWLDLVLSLVSDRFPMSDLVTGCVFTTRKGRCEMEVWLSGDPMLSPGKTDPQTEQDFDLAIRQVLQVEARDRTIQIAHRSHQSVWRQRKEHDRVHAVKQRKNKNGSTWPRTSSRHEVKQNNLEKCRQNMHEDPYQYMEKPQPYQYQYEDIEAGSPVPASPALVNSPPPSALLTRTPIQVPALPLEQLQQQQLDDLTLCLCGSPDAHQKRAGAPHSPNDGESGRSLDLASLRTRLDSVDLMPPTSSMFVFSPAVAPIQEEKCAPKPQPSQLSLPESFHRGRLPSDATSKAKAPGSDSSPISIDPDFERRTLYACDSDDGEELAEAQNPFCVVSGSSPSKLTMVLGTNPPDLSSPVMKAVMQKRYRYRSW